MAATIKEFGDQKVQLAISQGSAHGVDLANTVPSDKTAGKPTRTPWTAHLIFLIMLLVGGIMSTYMIGSVGLKYGLGETHTLIFGSGFSYALVQLGQGQMVAVATVFGILSGVWVYRRIAVGSLQLDTGICGDE